MPWQNQYEKHKVVSTAQGVKILGKDLEKTLAGLPLLVAYKEDEIPVLRVRSPRKPSSPNPPRPCSMCLTCLPFSVPAAGRADPRVEADAELHQAGGEGSVRAGIYPGLAGGPAGVPAHLQSGGKLAPTRVCHRKATRCHRMWQKPQTDQSCQLCHFSMLASTSALFTRRTS